MNVAVVPVHVTNSPLAVLQHLHLNPRDLLVLRCPAGTISTEIAPALHLINAEVERAGLAGQVGVLVIAGDVTLRQLLEHELETLGLRRI
jgi:hypothetical protein